MKPRMLELSVLPKGAGLFSDTSSEVLLSKLMDKAEKAVVIKRRSEVVVPPISEETSLEARVKYAHD